MNSGRTSEARDDFERVRNIDPNDPISRLYLAGIAMACGDLPTVLSY